jgi:hypothetical protein
LANDVNGVGDIIAVALAENELIPISVNASGDVANDISGMPILSKDGKYVYFSSLATNLVGPTSPMTRSYIKNIENKEIHIFSLS